MTATSPAARTATAPAVTVALAGIVVLAFVGAPQSVNTVLLAGIDQPHLIGTQLLIGLAGAIGTGVALLLVRLWAPLVLFGGLLVALSYLVHPVANEGLYAHVADQGEAPGQPDVLSNGGWVALLVGGAAVVLVGVLGAAAQLVGAGRRGTGIAIAGLAAGSGYAGLLLVSWLPVGWPRVAVLVLAVVVIAAAITVGRVGVGSPLPKRLVVPAWVAALLPVVPTVLVAVTGQPTYNSAVGTVGCVLVLAVALATTASAGVPVLRSAFGAALVLAAPVPLVLLVLADATDTNLWLAGVPAALVLAALVKVAPRPAALVGIGVEVLLLVFLAVAGTNDSGAWLLYALAVVSVTAAIGVGALLADSAVVPVLPVLAPLVTAVGVGIRVVLDAIQLKPSIGGLGLLYGSGALWLSAAMIVVGVLILSVRGSVVSLPLRR